MNSQLQQEVEDATIKKESYILQLQIGSFFWVLSILPSYSSTLSTFLGFKVSKTNNYTKVNSGLQQCWRKLSNALP